MARTATERDERLRAQLDWVRLIESFDEESAELALGSRLRETPVRPGVALNSRRRGLDSPRTSNGCVGERARSFALTGSPR